jgi:hypothetical protein
MSYRPWKGFTLIGAAILAEFLIPGAMHRTGLLFVISLFVTLGWAEGYVPEGWETRRKLPAFLDKLPGEGWDSARDHIGSPTPLAYSCTVPHIKGCRFEGKPMKETDRCLCHINGPYGNLPTQG